MSLIVLAFLARPGGGAGGAEASPPRVRARGAALEHACCRRHGATPGAERKAASSSAAPQQQTLTEHQRPGQLSCDGRRRGRRGEGVGSVARGVHTPRSPAAAVAWQARSSFASSARFAELTSPLCSGRGVWLVRCAWPRVAWLAPARAPIFWAGSVASGSMGGSMGGHRLFVIDGRDRNQPPYIKVPNAASFCAGNRSNHGGHLIPSIRACR